MTGGGMGFCARVAAPGAPVTGRGLGMRFGRGHGGSRGGGRGWRNMLYATGLTGWQRATAGWPMTGGVPPVAAPVNDQEIDALKSQVEYFESALGGVRKRLQEMEAQRAAK